MHPSVQALWQRYRLSDPSAPVDVPIAFHFCDNRDDANICAELVAAGRKRATATSLAELELTGDAMPRAGDQAIVTDWDGKAVAIIRTRSVDIRRFGDVDQDFAREEGEGDLTLQWWRSAHRTYYERVLASSGHLVDDDLQIACERFEIVMTA